MHGTSQKIAIMQIHPKAALEGYIGIRKSPRKIRMCDSEISLDYLAYN